MTARKLMNLKNTFIDIYDKNNTMSSKQIATKFIDSLKTEVTDTLQSPKMDLMRKTTFFNNYIYAPHDTKDHRFQFS